MENQIERNKFKLTELFEFIQTMPILGFFGNTQHNVDVSVCVYMYAYVHIKAQNLIYRSISKFLHATWTKRPSLSRKLREWTTKSHTKSQGRDWTKIRKNVEKEKKSEEKKKNLVHSVLK